MDTNRLPKPIVKFENHVAAWVQPPVVGIHSGELTRSTGKIPIGMARFPGRVSSVFMSIGSGKDDAADELSVTANVYVGANAVCSTAPKIAYVSGEASKAKTSADVLVAAGGVTPAVINPTYQDVAKGDIIWMQLALARTATPTTEISGVVVEVDIDPVLP